MATGDGRQTDDGRASGEIACAKLAPDKDDDDDDDDNGNDNDYDDDCPTRWVRTANHCTSH